MNEDTAVLTQKDLRQVARRWMCMAVNTYNYESQMAGSIIYATSDALRKIYADDNEYKAALNNHYKYFNTTRGSPRSYSASRSLSKARKGLPVKTWFRT